MKLSPGAITEACAKVGEILRNTAPSLPTGVLHDFVRYHFDQRDRYLGVLRNHPAPLYLLEPAVLKDRAGKMQQAFGRYLSSLSFYYAVKSNNHPKVAQALLDAGFGLDVSSGLELEMALDLGARDIVFSGPGKTIVELQLAAAHSDQVTVLLDSPGELLRLEEAGARQQDILRCGVRLTVNPHGLWRKFGIGLETLPAFWESARQCPHIQLAGLQFHSSWNLTAQSQIAFIRDLGNVLVQMPRTFLDQLAFVDIGGGYWPPQGEWLQWSATDQGRLFSCLGGSAEPRQSHYCFPAASIDDYAAQLCAALREHLFPLTRCRICLEPGRWICNDAMHLLISVVDKKASDLVITDAGTNSIGWERFESDYFPVLNLTRPAMDEKTCHVLGSLCTPHDVWGYTYFGDCIEPGDILMIPTQGAYTYSLRQHFIKPLPTVVCL